MVSFSYLCEYLKAENWDKQAYISWRKSGKILKENIKGNPQSKLIHGYGEAIPNLETDKIIIMLIIISPPTTMKLVTAVIVFFFCITYYVIH